MTGTGSRHLTKPGAEPLRKHLPVEAGRPGLPERQVRMKSARPQQGLVRRERV